MIDVDVTLQHAGAITSTTPIVANFTSQSATSAHLITAIIGKSGVGKSSLLAAIAGNLTPSRGHIRVAGRVLFDAAQGINLPPEQRGVGMVFQDGRLFPHLSVAGNLQYGAKFRNKHPLGAQLSLDDVVAMLGIGHLLERRPHLLSGGERQRVAIGRALLSRPQLLLMDEPLASLDNARRSELLDFIAELPSRCGLPVLYVTHQLDEVVRVAHDVVVMADGATVAHGPVAQVLSDLRLQPMVGRFDAGAVLEGRIAAHDTHWQLTSVHIKDAFVSIPQVNYAIDTVVRLHIRARDVSLSLARSASSASNQLHGHVQQLLPRDGPYLAVAVQLDDESQCIWALITRQSAERLALQLGSPVWTSFKAVAVESRAVARVF